MAVGEGEGEVKEEEGSDVEEGMGSGRQVVALAEKE